MSQKSEIRLCVVFKRHSKLKQVKTEMRIGKMIIDDNEKAFQKAIEKQESVLFDETDNDKEEDRVSFANRPKS